MSFGLNYDLPKISRVEPESIEALRSRYVYVYGENFQQAPPPPPIAVFFGTTPATSLIVESDTRLKVQVPAGLAAGEYEVQVRNGQNARLSNKAPLVLYMPKSANPNYVANQVDMMVQPLPPPFMSRKDAQRVASGSQFNGKLPDKQVGTFLGADPPTQGGIWRYAEDVIVQQFEFRSNGVEPGVGRLAGSGLFVKDRITGTEVEHLDMSGAVVPQYGVAESFVLHPEGGIHVKQGDEIIVRTFGATLEMVAIIDVKIERPYL